MVLLDPFKRANSQLRLLSFVVFGGLLVLVTGLWWLQVVKRHEYQTSLETQAYRTVRVPAKRGSIFDRNGKVLAETRPSYNLNLYLDEIRPLFRETYDRMKPAVLAALKARREEYQARVGRELSSAEKRRFQLRGNLRAELSKTARYLATSNLVAQIGVQLRTPLILNEKRFHQHYYARRAMPLPVITGMTPAQLARFSETSPMWRGFDVEVQPLRVYPHGSLAAHLLGHVEKDFKSVEGEISYYDFRLPDYRGTVGLEGGYDKELRGHAGVKSVLVNSLHYRQEDTVLVPSEPGCNLTLTLDMDIQEAAEAALHKLPYNPKGAVVVMDVNTGDVLAMASAPTYDPNAFVPGISSKDYARFLDEDLKPAHNRATQENYAPGSIFKPIVGLAALEHGLDPNKKFTVYPDPRRPSGGVIYVGNRPIHDTATPGNDYDFVKALKLSSNTYFITNGLDAGMEAILELGEQLHLGEPLNLRTLQETSGFFPSREMIHQGWTRGDTANICIGQGKIAVTPMQMAVMTAAIANGGKVLWPRLVSSIEPQDLSSSQSPIHFPSEQVRDHLRVQSRNLQIVRYAMSREVADSDGTGRFAAIPGVDICGKTGTADIHDVRGRDIGNTTWFISFAPYQAPRYAVVIMIEEGNSGGGTCAPLARGIYEALFPNANQMASLNRNH